MSDTAMSPARERSTEVAPSVLALPCAFGDGARIVVSCPLRKRDDGERMVEPAVSFAWVSATAAAEWHPPYGPIQIWTRAEPGGDVPTQPHWLFPFVRADRGLDWSQRAVDDNGLHGAAHRGDYAHVFAVLRRWAERRDREGSYDDA